MLAIAVGILVVSDIVILTIYTTAEGYHGNLVSVKVPNREKMEDTEGVGLYCVYVSLTQCLNLKCILNLSCVTYMYSLPGAGGHHSLLCLRV